MSRTAEILARLALAREQIQRERERGQREGENATRLAGAIPASIAALADLGGKAYSGAIEGRAKDFASTPVESKGIAPHVLDIGAPSIEGGYEETPEQAAQRAVAARKASTLEELFGIAGAARTEAAKALAERERARRAEESKAVESKLDRATGSYRFDVGQRNRSEDVARRQTERGEDITRKQTERSEDIKLAQGKESRDRQFQREIEVERNKRADAKEAKADAANAKQAEREALQDELTRARLAQATMGTREKQAELQATFDKLATARDQLKTATVGMVAGRAASAAEKMGFSEGTTNALKDTLQQVRESAAKLNSGGVLSNQEYDRALQQLDSARSKEDIEAALDIIENGTQTGAKIIFPDITFTGQRLNRPTAQAGATATKGQVFSVAVSAFQQKNGRAPSPDEMRKIAEGLK